MYHIVLGNGSVLRNFSCRLIQKVLTPWLWQLQTKSTRVWSSCSTWSFAAFSCTIFVRFARVNSFETQTVQFWNSPRPPVNVTRSFFSLPCTNTPRIFQANDFVSIEDLVQNPGMYDHFFWLVPTKSVQIRAADGNFLGFEESEPLFRPAGVRSITTADEIDDFVCVDLRLEFFQTFASGNVTSVSSIQSNQAVGVYVNQAVRSTSFSPR